MNALHHSLADRIIRHIRTAGLAEGTHLTESRLQELFGISRQPIRAALALLAQQGVLEQVPHKGFFLRNPEGLLQDRPHDPGSQSEEAIYLRIAEDCLTHALPARVTEIDLMRRYQIARPMLRRLMHRMSSEGWLEHNEGRGWTFATVIDSVEAYQECFDMRILIETQALLAPNYRYDRAVLTELRRSQEMLSQKGWQFLNQMELFEANCAFHEGLASLSGNRFLAASVVRLNQMRRLVEYRQPLDRDHVQVQNAEHLHILDLIEARRIEAAAAALERHLRTAKALKTKTARF